MNRLSNRVKKVESLTCHYHFSGEAHMQYLASKGVTEDALTAAGQTDPQANELFERLKERLNLFEEQKFKTPKTFWPLGRKFDERNRFVAYVVEYDEQAREIWKQLLVRIGVAAQEYAQSRTEASED
jgi:predicted transcriptional regulator YdeE